MGDFVTEIASLFVTVTTPIVVALVVYFMNERAKRREFARDKEYDRKRDGYEKAISALRGVEAVSGHLYTLSLLDKHSESATPENKLAFEALKSMFRHTLLISYRLALPEVQIGPEIKPEIPNKEYESFLMLVSMVRDFDRAVGSLALLDAPPELLKKLRLTLALVGSEEYFRKESDKGFETIITEIEDMMKQDLRMTIAGKPKGGG